MDAPDSSSETAHPSSWEQSPARDLGIINTLPDLPPDSSAPDAPDHIALLQQVQDDPVLTETVSAMNSAELPESGLVDLDNTCPSTASSLGMQASKVREDPAALAKPDIPLAVETALAPLLLSSNCMPRVSEENSVMPEASSLDIHIISNIIRQPTPDVSRNAESSALPLDTDKDDSDIELSLVLPLVKHKQSSASFMTRHIKTIAGIAPDIPYERGRNSGEFPRSNSAQQVSQRSRITTTRSQNGPMTISPPEILNAIGCPGISSGREATRRQSHDDDCTSQKSEISSSSSVKSTTSEDRRKYFGSQSPPCRPSAMTSTLKRKASAVRTSNTVSQRTISEAKDDPRKHSPNSSADECANLMARRIKRDFMRSSKTSVQVNATPTSAQPQLASSYNKSGSAQQHSFGTTSPNAIRVPTVGMSKLHKHMAKPIMAPQGETTAIQITTSADISPHQLRLSDGATRQSPALDVISTTALTVVKAEHNNFKGFDKQQILQPPTTCETIFEGFRKAYPDYTGDLKHFQTMCRKIEALCRANKPIHQSLYDDFIIRQKTKYATYASGCTELGEDPVPYETYYHNQVLGPAYTKLIITQATLSEALQRQNHNEVSEKQSFTSRAWTPPNGAYMSASEVDDSAAGLEGRRVGGVSIGTGRIWDYNGAEIHSRNSRAEEQFPRSRNHWETPPRASHTSDFRRSTHDDDHRDSSDHWQHSRQSFYPRDKRYDYIDRWEDATAGRQSPSHLLSRFARTSDVRDRDYHDCADYPQRHALGTDLGSARKSFSSRRRSRSPTDRDHSYSTSFGERVQIEYRKPLGLERGRIDDNFAPLSDSHVRRAAKYPDQPRSGPLESTKKNIPYSPGQSTANSLSSRKAPKTIDSSSGSFNKLPRRSILPWQRPTDNSRKHDCDADAPRVLNSDSPYDKDHSWQETRQWESDRRF